MLDGIIERVLFSNTPVVGETVRIILAFLGVILVSYYDLFNKKNVPDKLLYAFLGLAIIVDIGAYFLEPDLNVLLFSFGVAIFIGLVGYVFYRMGQIGGADVLTIVAVMLLVPFVPSFAGLAFNLPFIVPAMIYAGLIFTIFVTIKFALKIIAQGGSPNILYLLLIIPFLIFVYVYVNSPVFSPVYLGIVSILLLATIFFMVYKQDITLMLAEELPLDRIEPEDVVAVELMDPKVMREHKIKRVITPQELARLKESGVQTLWIYTNLPPFVPFLLLGMILALFFSGSLIFGF